MLGDGAKFWNSYKRLFLVRIKFYLKKTGGGVWFLDLPELIQFGPILSTLLELP